MDRLDALQALVLSKQLGSFAAAARAQGVTRSQISKLIASLEADYGGALFVRSTRAIALTSAGATLHDYAVDLLAIAAEARQAMAALRGTVAGPLRVNAPMSFGKLVLAPLLSEFLAQHPQVELRVELNDRLLDPFEHGFDLTLRIAQLPDSSLAARRMCAVPRAIYAAPGYLQAHGIPDSPKALKTHRCLNYAHANTGHVWHLGRGREKAHVAVDGPLCSNNGDLLVEAAVAGAGLILQPEFLAAKHIAAGRLVPVLPQWQESPEIALYALYPATRRVPVTVRALIDYLFTALPPAMAAA
ncbi:LysR family transcriptional regulator [Polaromonas jejuensis]|uniref:LysR substrate-binding domain-containing protein n=1 Tax=Polaromonas jejuensis TaxID=457502 RepID=A0ABW0QHE0_9BURK|nr:LysR family transcriptional regulator [Polaromonas jejuensis]